MPLTDRFQLFDLKRDEGARTFEAREIATGRPVLVHLFADSTSPLTRVLLAKLDTLPEAERARVIERGDHEGGVYLVTDRLVEYPGLREWLAHKDDDRPKPLDSASAWQTMPAIKAVTPPGKHSVDDELASLFDTAPLPVLEPSPTDAPRAPALTNTSEQTLKIPKPVAHAGPARPAPPSFIAPPEASPSPKEPGEFTRQFAPVLRPAAPPSKPEPPPSPSNEPGEFTRQFAPVLRPTPPPPSQPSPPQPPSSNEPGEFTRQFAPVLRPTPPAPSQPSPPPSSSNEPGEFTRQFQAPQRPIPSSPSTQTPQPRPTTKRDGEFTQMLRAQGSTAPTPSTPKSNDFEDYFQSPMTPGPLGSTQQLRPITPPPAARPGRGGEFTQVFGPGDHGGPSPSAPPPNAGATQVFRSPAPPPPPPPANFPAQQPLQGNPRQGSDEWGNMFDKPASLTFGQGPTASPSVRIPEAAPSNGSRNSIPMPLLLIVGGVVLLLVAVIVYLVMHQH